MTVRVPRPIIWSAVFEALDDVVERASNQDLLNPSRPRTIPLGEWIGNNESIVTTGKISMDSQSAESTTAIPSAPWALVVTRDIQLRRFLASYLSIAGFNAEEIDDVRMAIAMNAARDYFCALVESDMDPIDGFSLSRLLHVKRKDWPRVVLILPENNSLLRLRAHWAGAHSTVAQPLSRDALRLTMNKLRYEAASAKPR